MGWQTFYDFHDFAKSAAVISDAFISIFHFQTWILSFFGYISMMPIIGVWIIGIMNQSIWNLFYRDIVKNNWLRKRCIIDPYQEQSLKKVPVLHISDIRRPGSGIILSENGMKGVCSMLKRLLNLFRKPKTVQKEISRKPEHCVQLTLPLEW